MNREIAKKKIGQILAQIEDQPSSQSLANTVRVQVLEEIISDIENGYFADDLEARVYV